MQELAKLTRHPGTWTLNVQLLILYVVAVVMFFVIHWGNLKATAPFAGKGKGGAGPLAGVFVLAAGTSFIGLLTIVVLARKLGLVPPLAMAGLPLFLLLESHVRKLISSKDLVGFHLSGAAGVLAGMGSAAWIWMRPNPLV